MDAKSIIGLLTKKMDARPEVALVNMADRVGDLIETGSISDTDAVVIQEFLEEFCRKYKLSLSRRPYMDQGNNLKRLNHFVQEVAESKRKLLKQHTGDVISEALAEYSVNSGHEHSFGFAKLSKEEKASAHGHLDRLREIIEASKLGDRKKNVV
jgi:hypothetical protein